MKKLIVTIALAFTLFCITACTQTAQEVKFTATVLQNNGTSLLVAPAKDSKENKSSDKISVSADGPSVVDSQGRIISISEIKAGKKVEITYNGVILESYPAQIPKCSKIKILD